MFELLAGLLFGIFFLPTKLYYLWLNYKGRFRYRLWEYSPTWRPLDKKIGTFALVLDFVLSVSLIAFFSILIASLFQTTMAIAVTIALSGAVGWTLLNMGIDKNSIEAFEKTCLECEHKEECMKFHNEYCSNQGVKGLAKGAVYRLIECNKKT